MGTPPSPPAAGRAQETPSTGVTLSLLCCITASENGAGGNLLLRSDMGRLAPTLFQPCPVLYHSQGRNTRHFHSSAVCAELTSAQSLWPICSTATASHHTICVSDRRDAGQVLFFPQQHIFQGSPIKNNMPKPCKMLSCHSWINGKTEKYSDGPGFPNKSPLHTASQNSLVDEEPSSSSPNYPSALSIRNAFHGSRLCNFAWSRISNWLG